MTQEEKELINKLNEKQTYFEAILALSQSQGISQLLAWEQIEAQRIELGLQAKYTSFESFRVSKSIFYRKMLEIENNSTTPIL